MRTRDLRRLLRRLGAGQLSRPQMADLAVARGMDHKRAAYTLSRPELTRWLVSRIERELAHRIIARVTLAR